MNEEDRIKEDGASAGNAPLPGNESTGGTAAATATRRQSPARAIRDFCVSICMNGYLKEVRKCNDAGCPLRPYRMGKSRTVHLSPEQKARKRAAFEQIRQRCASKATEAVS